MADIINTGLIGTAYDWMTGQSPFSDPVLRFYLFVNNFTVDCDTVDSDLTKCTAPGYADQVLTPTSWSDSITSCVLSADYPTFNFSFTGPGTPGQTIYGYALSSDTYSAIWWANNLPSPYVLPPGASVIEVTLNLMIQECGDGMAFRPGLAPRMEARVQPRRKRGRKR